MPAENTIGMAGHVIAAVLETAGFYSLSQILDNARPVIHSVGYFLWVWCAVGGVLSVAVFGNYRQALYLLVGPTILFWMLDFRVPVTETVHQFGDRRSLPADVNQKQIIADSMNPNAGSQQAYVPKFIELYDRMVSSVVQQTVALLVDTKNKEDMIGTARERMMSRVLMEKGADPEFLRLITSSLLGSCAKQFGLEGELGEPRLARAVAGSPEAAEAAFKRQELAKLKSHIVPFDKKLAEFVRRTGIEPVQNPNCDDVWSYTRHACLRAANGAFTPTSSETEDFVLSNQDWQRVADDVKRKLNPEAARTNDTTQAVSMLAAFFLRNSIANTPQGKLTGQMEGHLAWNDRDARQIFGDVANAEAEGAHFTILYFAAALPYLQGVILYVLLISFPFFALLLVMPSRIKSFVIWMALWAWVKSWDIGFALVAFLRDIFWTLMPNAGAERARETFRTLDWNQPASVMNLIYENDPSMNLNTYYSIIGLLTMAVPLITAHFCLGATHAYDALRLSFDGNAREAGQQRTSGARVRRARKIETDMSVKRAAAAERGYNYGIANPGTLTGRNISRADTKDSSLSNHAMRTAIRDEYRYANSRENITSVGDLAGFHGRRIGPGTRAESMVAADINEFNEMFEGNSMLGSIGGDNAPAPTADLKSVKAPKSMDGN